MTITETWQHCDIITNGIRMHFVTQGEGPLVVLLAKREHSAFVATHAKEALNFNITFLLGALVCCLLLQFSIGILFGAVLFVFWLVMTIIARLGRTSPHRTREVPPSRRQAPRHPPSGPR